MNNSHTQHLFFSCADQHVSNTHCPIDHYTHAARMQVTVVLQGRASVQASHVSIVRGSPLLTNHIYTRSVHFYEHLKVRDVYLFHIYEDII